MQIPAARRPPDMPAFSRLHKAERRQGDLSTPSPPKQSHALPQPAAFSGSARAASAPAGAPHAALHSRVSATSHLPHMHCTHAARLPRQHHACSEHCQLMHTARSVAPLSAARACSHHRHRTHAAPLQHARSTHAAPKPHAQHPRHSSVALTWCHASSAQRQSRISTE